MKLCIMPRAPARINYRRCSTLAKAKASGVAHAIGTFFKWFFIILGTLILVGALTCAFLACYGVNYIRDVIIPQVENSSLELVEFDTTLSSYVYSYNSDTGTYETMQVLYAGENRVWADFEDIPDQLINATVAIEDKRFWDHNGVDWIRTAAAVLYMFTGQDVQGGSTITQQLIKNLTQENEVTVKRKVLEIFEALEFDRTHSKEETLEWYLNEIYLGRSCYGVVTAADVYYGKTLDELSLAECASLISITNNPSLYDPYSHTENNHNRACTVILEMLDQGKINQTEADAALADLGMVWTADGNTDEDGNPTGEYIYHADQDKLVVVLKTQSDEGEDSLSTYSWYTDAVIDQVIEDLMEEYSYDERTATNLVYQGGLKIYTCFDADVQASVDAIYEDESNFSSYTSSSGKDLRSAITVVDNSTGAVVALAGGVGEKSGNRIWNDATDTIRPTGSSIKPLAVYAPALEEGLITPYSVLDDSPVEENEDGSLWPTNSEHYYSGLTSIYTAVVESLNTVSVKTLQLLTPLTSYEYLTQKFGITSLVADDIDYAPLALGGQTYGISTLEMAAAYATFPNSGVYTSPYLYTVVMDSNGRVVLATDGYDATMDTEGNVTITGSADNQTILSTETCYYITTMLRGVVNEGNGTGWRAAIAGVDEAGKSGTTTNNCDRWFCGYTSDYTAVVWCGYDTQEEIPSSVQVASQTWGKVMTLICENRHPEDMTYDVETVRASYCTASGDKPTELCELAGCVATGTFVKGDEPTSTCQLHVSISLCAASGKLAGDKCLETTSAAALNYVRTGAAAKAEIESDMKTVADYQAEGVCEGETRTYKAPVFNWAADYSTCQAVFTSEDEKDVQTLDCVITTTVTAATAQLPGSTTYTATVTFNEQSYTDVKTVTTPTENSENPNGENTGGDTGENTGGTTGGTTGTGEANGETTDGTPNGSDTNDATGGGGGSSGFTGGTNGTNTP